MSLTPTQLATHAAKALQQATGPVTLAYHWPQPWNGGDSIVVDGQTLPLRHCVSPLEIREALAEASDVSRVLLVSQQETGLGQDVLARVFRHRLLHVDRWQLVQEIYGVCQIDPRLFGMTWLPDALLAAAPARRTTAAAALTLDEAMSTCLAPVLGTGAAQIDLERLLHACEDSGQRWAELGAEAREQFRHFLVNRLGALADALLRTLDAGNGHAALGIGLACEVLYSPHAAQQLGLRDARVRLEQRLDGLRLKDDAGRQWAELSQRAILQRDTLQRQEDFRLAMELLEWLGAADFIGLSSLLPQALDRRLADLGKAVTSFMRSPATLPDVEAASQRVLDHRLPPADHPGPECARMLARLCRYEASLSTAEPAADPVADYLTHGAWEDWVRRSLRGARPEALARAVARLLDRVSQRRTSGDRAFAEKLAQATAADETPRALLPIESALSFVVAPLAQHNPVVLVVLDGMSQDVYLAIAETMAHRGWCAWSRPRQPRALLATIPSVTECSRASLLAGRLARGGAAQERQAFARHEDLRQASRAGKPPLLLHKAGLEQSHQLSAAAVEALSDPEQRIVAVVINAIDDALAKSEQVRIDWTLESIPLLAAVLEQARRGGRTVVLTADHGHVLERQSTLRGNGEGERWRRPGNPPEDGEILMSGPRVSTLMGEPLVAPWSEQIRYGVKKNGYHGGVARQEMLVPLGLWTADAAPPRSDADELVAAVPMAPEWWNATDDGATAAPPRPAKRRGRCVRPPIDDLFATSAPSAWLDDLLQSPQLARQRQRAGRMALQEARLCALLTYLDEHGGRAGIDQLAAAIEQPRLRMRGIVSAMERMLNIDGFPVITLEQGSGTVLLDIELLKKQFLA
ncbi:BREX-2 system phosphatase PglZ [Nitrococcus mobilis]|uniref:Uncharacterized protein n=1 Tax=Nitrococcus mobilis Nb-231 TaxID=314278 RepID=A4BLZ2_9GAMM|nr:BREX-2 system phosphatase PglZ [Nitrococcus mobilis]EAR23330.1 hypothetical protein NB231_15958 [Nitrococcus mobilis Nb-231]